MNTKKMIAAGLALAATTSLAAVATPAASARTINRLACSSTDGSGNWRPTIRPSACFLNWDANNEFSGLSLAESAHPRRLHWTSWGRTANATGFDRAKLYTPWIRVKVHAYRLRATYSGQRFYTRIHATFFWDYGPHTATWRLPSGPPGDD
jgi:hypothetical protein